MTRRRAEDGEKFHLKRSRAELVAPATLRDFRKVVDQPLKYVCSIQVTVVVHVDVHHTLGIWWVERGGQHMGEYVSKQCFCRATNKQVKQNVFIQGDRVGVKLKCLF